MLLIILLLLGFHLKKCELVTLGPVLTAEPAPVVAVGAGGARLHCAATGDPPPRISWLAADGSPLLDEPGLRRVLGDGSLQVTRVRDPLLVRCRAASPRGAVLSRLVTLQPVTDTSWEAVVEAAPVSEGGVAALRCRSSGSSVPLLPTAWYRDGRAIDTTDPRYLSAGDTLLIRDASPSDAVAYSCLARHPHSDLAKRSAPIALNVIPSAVGSAGGAPRLATGSSELSVPRGAPFCLPCAAADYPVPHYTWYREREGRLQPVQVGGNEGGSAVESSLRAWAGGAALCARAVPELAGAWLCKAYNGFGDATLQLRLHVDADLKVTVTPSVVVAEVGSTVTLNCSTNVAASLSWLHDGTPLQVSGVRLAVRGVGRAHRGMYQCVAARGSRTAHAASELRLADSAPELQYTFIEQALRAGGTAALRCVAAASPPPRLSWLLDGQPIDHFLPHHRYRVSEESTPLGDAASLLNVSVSATDGGRYTCRAHNALGAAEHSARLNVYGPPAVRALGPLRVVAGENVTVYCPYSGYPISSVWWRRSGGASGGGGVEVGAAGRVSSRDGALRLQPALARDAGRYSCGVTAPGGATAAGDVDIQIRNPPKISPFIFSSELIEGSAVQVLCGVSSGDKPMYFSWVKDGQPIPSDLQIEEKSLNEFSLLMFSDLTARHSGDYTCRVSNHAATTNYTANLSVKVAPSWVTEPLDSAVLLGAPLLLECAAKGFPTPIVTWYRKIGGGIEGLDRWETAGAEWGQGEGFSHAAGGAVGGGDSGAAGARLSARSATRDLQGVYRCTADNGVGAPLMKNINVTVHEPAHFAGPEASARNVSGVRGAAAALWCEARGDAPLALHWAHRGVKLDLDSFRWTISETRSGEGLRSLLKLRSVEREDAGEYRCHAHNRFGRSELVMFLHVEEPPEAPRSVQLAGASSHSIRVRWRARPEAEVHYSALCTPLHNLLSPGDTTQVFNLTLEAEESESPDSQGYRSLSSKLDGLRPSAAYSLRLVASNHVGQSPHSEPLLFTTLEEAPSGTPQNIHVKPINTEELHVAWSAPPQHTWNGELLGYAVSWRELSRFEEGSSEGWGLRSGCSVSSGWSSSELALRGLRQFARYAVTVRSYNTAGAGPHSPVVYATTADGVPETPPSAVTCVADGARSLRVRWTPPRGGHDTLRGYDVLYAQLHSAPTWSGAGAEQMVSTAGGGAREALVPALLAAHNYSVRVQARAARGAGPPSPPVHCATHEDVPGAVEILRAVAVSHEAVRVSWLPPAERTGHLTHYTLHIRELGKVGGEWSQRVETAFGSGDEDGEGGGECSAEVSGLRARAAFEFRVRAHAAAGGGPRSRAAAAATAQTDSPVSARIWSMGRVVWAREGGAVRLRCAAAGSPPLARRWAPLPLAHTLTDAGDLLLHKVETEGNYTCSVRNAAGGDRMQYAVRVRRVPSAPILRLLRADSHALHLLWDPPPDNGSPILGYSVWWKRAWAGGDAGSSGARSMLSAGTKLALRGLACGAPYAVWLHAHNAVGASPPSHTLTLRTKGDKAKAPPGKELIWANSTALRLNLLTWGGRCPVARWALRVADHDVTVDGESATVDNLEPGRWYDIRVTAYSPAGETLALYRAATLTANGEQIGAPTELPLTVGASAAEGAGGAAGAGGGFGGAWRGALAAALAAAALALLAAAAALLATRLRSPRPQPVASTKKLPPQDGDLQEISPYATFSMSSSATGGARSCALHVHSLARADSLELAAPPPRPLLAPHSTEYGSGSESSGSPCAACAAELYRVPAARLADTLPAAEWCADERRGARRGVRSSRPDTEERGERGDKGERARRRDAPRHVQTPTGRYFSAASLESRQAAL